MSAGDINTLLNIWTSTLATHGAEPPFRNADELYNTIDSTPLGDIPWEDFTVTYDGDTPDDARLPWMDAEYEAWFRNPEWLVRNMLLNPDFKDEFDCAPFHEYDKDGNHRFHNFMSGDWVWKQGVRDIFIYIYISIANHIFRTSLPRIQRRMGQCSSRSSLAVTKPLFP